MFGTCLEISHLWSPCLLLLGLWGCPGTVPWHHPSCLPLSVSAPHPILGFWELPRRGIGCTSQEHSAMGQEVHIISLRGGVPAKAQVTLVLGSDPPHRAPIFVLRSQEPLNWMLPSPPGKNWTFQVSPGSSVSAPGPVASTEISFPETRKSLLQWARREHGGVTSLAEYHGVNTIYIRLGAGMGSKGGTAPATCKLRRNFLKSEHFASERRRQPLRICLNSDPPHDLEVHIVFSKGVASRGLAHLTVELHALKRSPHQNLFLILKSEGTAQWIVHAHRLTGQLHVLASHKVVVSSTGVDPSLTVTQHTSPGLARIRDPLQWVANQKLPVFTSYTEAEHVNRFFLTVGMNGATSDPKLFGPAGFAGTEQHFPAAVTVGWPRRQGFLAEGSTSLLLPPTVKTAAEGAQPVLCPGEQKPSHENRDIQSISCVSPSSTQASLPEATVTFQGLPFHLGNVLLSLEVYNSDTFVKQPGPCVVSANSRVFVEAALAAYDLCLGFTIRQCFLSPFSDASLPSPYLLIQHGCVADIHVTLSGSEQAAQGHALPPGYQERQRLSFMLQPIFNDSIQFLHCHLTLCSREPWDTTKPKSPIPKCQSENETCKVGEELASGRFRRTISKPLIVTVEIPPRAAAPDPRPDNFLLTQRGKALKDVNHSWKTQPVPTIATPQLQLPAVVGIAFSAFIIGISLTGGLWFIHSQTGGCAAAHRATEHEETNVPKAPTTPSAPTAAGRARGSPP